MANIGIIGYGIVGKATDYGLNKDNKIKFYDKYKSEDVLNGVLKKGSSMEEVVDFAEFIFICLPTPFSESGQSIDLSIMDENIGKIAKLIEGTNKIIIIKSTVIPGTTKKYAEKYLKCKFCFNPEFLTEANYLQDFVNSDRIVVGADDNKVRLRVSDLYKNTFPTTPLYLTDLTTAEMVKYMANTFFATKVIFSNEMYDLCNKLGIKYEEVREMVVADKRMGKSHLDVTSLRGFGGKCFPKDIIALIGLYNKLGVDASLLKTVWEKNLKIRKIRDWEEIPFVKSN